MKLANLIITLMLNISLCSTISNAQSPFDNPKNLEVLPNDISADQLRSIMRGFSFALNVRCTHCHDTTEDENGFSLVFETSNKETKKIAREMLKMTHNINNTVSNLNRGEDHQYTRVVCTTCHRGQENPFLIQTVLDKEIAEGGVVAAKAKYNDLKEEYYGGHTYDFSGFTLSEYANSLMERGQLEDAIDIALFSQNANPKTPYSHTMVGNIYMEMENYAEAVKAYESSLEVDPEQSFLEGLLEKAKAALK